MEEQLGEEMADFRCGEKTGGSKGQAAATVAGSVIAMGPGAPPPRLVYSPLPLFAPVFTGLYMVVLPHAAGWRTGRHAREQD